MIVPIERLLVPTRPPIGGSEEDRCHTSRSIDGNGQQTCHLPAGAWSIADRYIDKCTTANVVKVSDSLDIDAMLERFRERAKAVRSRPMPPVEGPERKRIIDRAQVDFMDYAIIGDAQGTLEDGVLVLRVDLRPSK
jgi:hypothetical protein